MIHVVHFGAAQHIEAADPVQRGDLLLDRVGNLVLRQQLADGPVLTLGARSVVAEDIEDQRVVAQALAVEFVDQLAGLHVHMLDEAGEDFHQPALERLLGVGDVGPSGHVSDRAA